MIPSKKFHIVLFQPEIPQNTGSIGRMAVSNDVPLHLIRPLGFSLDEKHLRRAGMDYWPKLELHLHDSWEDFLADGAGPKRLYFFTTKSERSYWDCPFEEGAYLIFGRESAGLPPDFYTKYASELYTIPMFGNFHRSLNLATSVGIVLYEGFRQSMASPGN